MGFERGDRKAFLFLNQEKYCVCLPKKREIKTITASVIKAEVRIQGKVGKKPLLFSKSCWLQK